MKRLMNLVQRHLVRPILYSTVTKTVLGLCIVLVWDRLVNAKSIAPMGVVDTGFFFIGVYYLTWVWIQYLVFDGVKSLQFLQTDTDSDLEEDEQTAVRFWSNLIVSLMFLIPSLIVSFAG